MPSGHVGDHFYSAWALADAAQSSESECSFPLSSYEAVQSDPSPPGLFWRLGLLETLFRALLCSGVRMEATWSAELPLCYVSVLHSIPLVCGDGEAG